jgi:hypothetical protein
MDDDHRFPEYGQHIKKEDMKNISKAVSAILLTFSAAANAQVNSPGQSLNYNNSPLNYENSSLNYNNSPLNYNNSPLNYNNSPLNYNATNGVYDSGGNRVGYETKSPSGVTNYFDNSGNRIGYGPKGGR